MRRGFTLLEVLVATFIMAVAVVGLVANLSNSVRNAARLTDHDRAAVLAKRKMDELLLNRQVPRFQPVQGAWTAEQTGSIPVRWQAVITPYEWANLVPGASVFDRVELTVFWQNGANERNLRIEGYRTGVLWPGDVERLQALAVAP
jgi:general secretion pathway protein I